VPSIPSGWIHWFLTTYGSSALVYGSSIRPAHRPDDGRLRVPPMLIKRPARPAARPRRSLLPPAQPPAVHRWSRRAGSDPPAEQRRPSRKQFQFVTPLPVCLLDPRGPAHRGEFTGYKSMRPDERCHGTDGRRGGRLSSCRSFGRATRSFADWSFRPSAPALDVGQGANQLTERTATPRWASTSIHVPPEGLSHRSARHGSGAQSDQGDLLVRMG
jgi:hypothetical protein